MIETVQEALAALDEAWPKICDECLQVRGGERQYQAMIYHWLRTAGGVPVAQIGLNVRQFVSNVQSEHFRQLAASRHSFHRGFDTDVVIFNPSVGGDWRRRASDSSLRNMLVAIDVIASTDQDGSSSHRKRLRADDVIAVIRIFLHNDKKCNCDSLGANSGAIDLRIEANRRRRSFVWTQATQTRSRKR